MWRTEQLRAALHGPGTFHSKQARFSLNSSPASFPDVQGKARDPTANNRGLEIQRLQLAMKVGCQTSTKKNCLQMK